MRYGIKAVRDRMCFFIKLQESGLQEDQRLVKIGFVSLPKLFAFDVF